MGSSKLPVDASPGSVGLHVHPSNPKSSVASGQGEKKELLQHSQPSSCNLCRQQCPGTEHPGEPQSLGTDGTPTASPVPLQGQECAGETRASLRP